jgi:hypothetical protein
MKLTFPIRILNRGTALSQEAFPVEYVTFPALNEI